MYNLTSIGMNSSTGILGFMQGVNTELMQGYLGTIMLLMITVIALISFLTTTGDTKKSLAATGFILMTLAILLRAIDLIPNIIMFAAIIIAAGALAISGRE